MLKEAIKALVKMSLLSFLVVWADIMTNASAVLYGFEIPYLTAATVPVTIGAALYAGWRKRQFLVMYKTPLAFLYLFLAACTTYLYKQIITAGTFSPGIVVLMIITAALISICVAILAALLLYVWQFIEYLRRRKRTV